MQLSNEAIEEFRSIYRREFGKDISDAEAERLGTNLLRLFSLLCRSSSGKPGQKERTRKTSCES